MSADKSVNTKGMIPRLMVKTLEAAIKANHPIMIVGSPGIGKSDIVEQAAKAAGADLFVEHPVVSDPTDPKGMPAVVDGEAVFLPFGNIKKLTTATRPTVCFLDDLGQAPPAVQAGYMQLLLARRVNDHKVSNSVTFIAATNDRTHGAGVSGILEPVKGRFASILHLETDTDDWTRWAINHQMPSVLTSFIRFRPEQLNAFEVTKDMTNSPTPRTVASVGKMLNAGYPKEAYFQLFSGACGEGWATEFKAFAEIHENLPDPDAVLADPESFPINLKKPNVVYALTGAIASRANERTFDAIVKFLDRLPAEFSTYGFFYAVTVYPQASKTNFESFGSWVNAHPHVIF
jgi:hypothetical protein